MTINQSIEPAPVSVAQSQLARVSADGCGRHAHIAMLLEATGRDCGRDLSDAVHLLCSLHGRHPGLIALAEQRCGSGESRDWLARASAAFEGERLYLLRLTAAVGPLPSTPGAAETEATLLAARHALETLATSERNGCALGAASALVGDWWSIRRLLDRVAARLSIECPATSLPDERSVVEVIEQACDSPARERALAFGSEQLLLQHRGLFDLLEARASARQGY